MAKRLRRPPVNPSILCKSWIQARTSGQLQSLAQLRRENSLPVLPDLSMCDNIRRNVVVVRGEAENLQKSGDFCSLGDGLREKSRKMWVETEQELDALRRALRPRRRFCLSRSQSVAPVAISPPPDISLPQPDLSIPPNPAPCRIKKPLLKLFANLPKLPFGQHKSYNDVADRSVLFVQIKPTRRVRKVIGRPIKQA